MNLCLIRDMGGRLITSTDVGKGTVPLNNLTELQVSMSSDRPGKSLIGQSKLLEPVTWSAYSGHAATAAGTLGWTYPVCL